MNDEGVIRVLKSDQLPEMQRPHWLAESALDSPLPIQALLSGSVFYPASGLDSDPLMHLGHHFWSFVYADYGFTPEFIQSVFGADRFAGYKLLGRRSVTVDEVPLARWHSESVGYLEGGNNREARERATPPFAEWALLERDYGPDRPRELMSILFVSADAVTLFKKLYAETGATPDCIAIIQPGDGVGDQNWTNFKDPNAFLARAVLTNSVGTPSFLLYGGNGKPEWYKDAVWPSYDACLAWPLERKINRGDPNAAGYSFRGTREGALSLWKRTEGR